MDISKKIHKCIYVYIHIYAYSFEGHPKWVSLDQQQGVVTATCLLEAVKKNPFPLLLGF